MPKTLIKILVAVLVLTILIGVGLSNFIKCRATHAANPCINNLREIDAAKMEWSLEMHKTTNDTPTWNDLRPFIAGRYPDRIPVCPWGGTYTIGKVGENPTCSFKGPPAHQLN